MKMLRNILFIAFVISIAVFNFACAKQVSVASLTEKEQSIKSNYSKDDSFSGCGVNVFGLMVANRIELEDTKGRIFLIIVDKGWYPKDSKLSRFYDSAGKCFIVVETPEQAREQNKAHAQRLLDSVKGGELQDYPLSTETQLSSTTENTQAVRITWQENGENKEWVVDNYIHRKEHVVQELQKDYSKFFKIRWDQGV